LQSSSSPEAKPQELWRTGEANCLERSGKKSSIKMKIKKTSYFQDPESDKGWLVNWAEQLEHANNRQYERITVETALGKTHVWGLNTQDSSLEALVIFPGARTSSLFWDFDRGLDNLGGNFRIYMVETNGLPNLSDGDTPDIRSLDYGEWASDVMDALKLQSAYVAGASFGGLICMKLAIYDPFKIKSAFLLNPGCLQPFSLTFKNLFYNLLPIIAPNKKNISRFLDKAVFCKPHHMLSETAEELILDYGLFALTHYKDNTQKPYDMDEELLLADVNTYLLLGDKDLLFPYRKSIRNANKKLTWLKDIKVFGNVGHGIETYSKAMCYIGKKIGSEAKPDSQEAIGKSQESEARI
jgi:pimeloyl-ACP methyl ester carboxylesterase